ncbi:hypothetical protein H6F86_02085 [Phormidium sp. FACHB-592]|uniref:Uncharacterized protein n=1 Tax=Stenomitos frigidus AS-A4 TaxID=2933935 RepID=A0ABV0KMG4_9CYAN|nr:hypothetical protein [Phormidium sp. FACHB-592]MBD2072696.1 hypothetical protein [Phormidium sp. FACHB-592]
MSKRKKPAKPQLSIDQQVELLQQRLTPVIQEYPDLKSSEVRDLLKPIAIKFQISIKDLLRICQDYRSNRGWESKPPRMKGAREVLLPQKDFFEHLFECPAYIKPLWQDGDL